LLFSTSGGGKKENQDASKKESIGDDLESRREREWGKKNLIMEK